MAATQPDSELIANCTKWIDEEFESLEEILRGLAAVGELTPRTQHDRVVSGSGFRAAW